MEKRKAPTSPGLFTGADGRPIPKAVVVIGAAVCALVTAIPFLPDAWLPLSLLPGFMREAAALPVALIFVSMPLIMIALAITKLRELRGAAKWGIAEGRIVASAVEARHAPHVGGPSIVQNLASVAYEFTVAGALHRGTRINLDEIQDPSAIEATLARYPVGAGVKVYYDPKDPENCVLERGLPKGLGMGCLAALACVVLLCGAVYAVYVNFDRLAAALPARANAPVAIFAGLVGIFAVLLFALARRSAKAFASWPRASGKVVMSTVESYRQSVGRNPSTVYEPAVEYAYQVHGHEYRSRQITLDSRTGGLRSFAEKAAARYPVGMTVELRYDPSNPSRAALRVGRAAEWVVLAVALVAFAIAVSASRIFG
jgi:hypothetical protein